MSHWSAVNYPEISVSNSTWASGRNTVAFFETACGETMVVIQLIKQMTHKLGRRPEKSNNISLRQKFSWAYN